MLCQFGKITLTLAFALWFGTVSAFAQENNNDLEDQAEDVVEEIEELAEDLADEAEGIWDEVQATIVPPTPRDTRIPQNFLAEIGGGGHTFDGDLSDALEGGATWNIRGGFNNDNLLGAEGSLYGLSSSARDADLSDMVLGVGGDVSARFNWLNRSIVQPFGTVGLGAMNLTTVGRSGLELPDQVNVDAGDNTMITVPLTIGAQMYPVENFTFSGRLGYNLQTGIVNNELPDGNQWNLSVNVGATF